MTDDKLAIQLYDAAHMNSAVASTKLRNEDLATWKKIVSAALEIRDAANRAKWETGLKEPDLMFLLFQKYFVKSTWTDCKRCGLINHDDIYEPNGDSYWEGEHWCGPCAMVKLAESYADTNFYENHLSARIKAAREKKEV